MEIGWIIALSIISGIIAIWLIALVVTVIFVNVFSKKIRKGNIAVNLLLHQRYEIMKSFISLLEENNIEVSAENKRGIENLERVEDFQKLPKDERDLRVMAFLHSSHSIWLNASKHDEELKGTMYEELSTHFWETEESYRQKSAIYNSDVIGYNYWINIPHNKFIFKLFKKTPKDLIV